MIKAIFLDMDDTLIVNQVMYEEAQATLRGYMRHFGVLPEEAQKVFNAKDKELFLILGYSRERMPASFEAVLKHFVPEADAEMTGIVRGFAEKIFDTVAKMKPGTPEAIELLTEHYPVYIITQGDKSVQETRLSHLDFKDKLSGAFIVDKKDKDTFASIAGRLGFKPDEVVMMGDSVKSDIIPSVAAGMHAVWIEAHNSSLHESAPDFPRKMAYRFSSLLEASRHIVMHGTPSAPIVLPASVKKFLPPKAA